MRKFWSALLASAICITAGNPALADNNSDRITLIVPYSAGGQTDTTARVFAEHLRKVLGRTVVVDNRTGASGGIGATAVAQAAADGNTIMIGGVSTYLLPILNKAVKYDAAKQLRPVAQISSAPLLLVVRADSRYKSVDELLQAGRSRALTFGSSGVGTSPHLAAQWLMSVTKSRSVHVPYRGGPALTQALLSGDVDFVVDVASTTVPLIKSGKLRALGATSPSSLPAVEGIPLISKSVPGYVVSSWLGIFAPAATPDAVIDRLESALKTVSEQPDVRNQMKESGNPVEFKPKAEFSEHIAKETARFTSLIKQLNLTIE